MPDPSCFQYHSPLNFSMAQVVLNKQDFNCPICLDLLEDPIAIPCGHSYCRHCIWEHWERNTDLETVSCPQCRQSFSPMPLLGRNILLAETMEKLRASNQQEAALSSPITVFASTAMTVQGPHTSSSVSTNVQQPRTSASVSNARQPRTSASVATNVRWSRVLALLLACVAFSVALNGKLDKDKQVGEWCFFCWGFSFSGTAVVLLVELCGLQSRTPVSWKNFPITFACYACLLCLSSSILFAVYFVKDFSMHDGVSYNCRMVALVFSCLATIAYLTEVSISKAWPGTSRDRRTGYMATEPGLLKVCETFVACFILVFIINPNSYDSNTAIQWCMAVYCICFILSSMVIIACVRNSTACLSFTSICVLALYAMLATIMYLTATIIWPIYKFDQHHEGNPMGPLECHSSSPSLCPFDKLIVVAVLTSVNFILYLADLAYSIKLLASD